MDGRGRFKNSIHTCASKFVTLPGRTTKTPFHPKMKRRFQRFNMENTLFRLQSCLLGSPHIIHGINGSAPVTDFIVQMRTGASA